jgi:hypothetical protein
LEVVDGVFWAGFEVRDDGSRLFRDGDGAKEGNEAGDIFGNAKVCYEFAGRCGNV